MLIGEFANNEKSGHQQRLFLSILPQTEIFLAGWITATDGPPYKNLTYVVDPGVFATTNYELLKDAEVWVFEQNYLTRTAFSFNGNEVDYTDPFDSPETISSQQFVYGADTPIPKARLRVSARNTTTATNLAIEELSIGSESIDIHDYFVVVKDWQIRHRTPADTVNFEPDGIAYANQTRFLSPVCNSGGPKCFLVEDGPAASGYGDELSLPIAELDGSASYPMDMDASSVLTHRWLVSNDGRIPQLTGEIVRFPVRYEGTNWIYHEVEDSNGTSASQWIPIIVERTPSLTYQFTVDNLSSTPEQGWTLDFTLYNQSSDFYDFVGDVIGKYKGAQVVLWAVDEMLDGSQPARAYAHASQAPQTTLLPPHIKAGHVLFTGWLTDESFTKTPDQDKGYGLTAFGALAILRDTPGYSNVLVNKNTPTKWEQIKDLSIARAIDHQLEYYTTANRVCDLFMNFTDVQYPELFIQKNTPGEQVNDLAQALDCRLTCDRRGALLVDYFPAYVPLPDRDQHVAATLTLNHMQELIAETPQRETLEHIRVEGIQPNGAGRFSQWPGAAPGRGPQTQSQDGLIVLSQDDLNQRTGRRAAFLDRKFQYLSTGLGLVEYNQDGTQAFYYSPTADPRTVQITADAPEVQLILPGALDIFDPAYLHFWRLDLDGFGKRPANAVPRYVEAYLEVFRYFLRDVSITFADGTASTSVSFYGETNGFPGTTFTPAESGDAAEFENSPQIDPDLFSVFGVGDFT